MNGTARQSLVPALGLVAVTGFVGMSTTSVHGQSMTPSGDDTLALTGVVRDFREATWQPASPDDAGVAHPDFERRPEHGFGLYCGNIDSELGLDRKPVFTGNGFKVSEQWRDSGGNAICYALFDAAEGDVAGAQGVSDTGGIYSAESFNQWYNDVPGVNDSAMLTLTLQLQEDGSYVFDDKLDPTYTSLGGFFPIEDQLFGNPGGSPDRNFHFTFELHTRFRYDDRLSQVFTFVGDDDVWVFIDNKLVIDLGGVHGSTSQTVDLSRLGLMHNHTYDLDFFFAERHRTQSNFRIQTNLTLQSVDPSTISKAYD